MIMKLYCFTSNDFKSRRQSFLNFYILCGQKNDVVGTQMLIQINKSVLCRISIQFRFCSFFFFSNSYNLLKLFYINRVKIHQENSLSNRFILMYITKYSIISIYEIISYKSLIKIYIKIVLPVQINANCFFFNFNLEIVKQRSTHYTA